MTDIVDGGEQRDISWAIYAAGEIYQKFCEMCPYDKPNNMDFEALIWSMMLKSDQDFDEQLDMLKAFIEMVELAKKTT